MVLYDSTPLHKENFLSLCRNEAYVGVPFHRVIENFMVQGGDVTLLDESGYDENKTLPAEFHPAYFHKRGALAAARQGDGVNPARNSSAYQFYIVQGEVQVDTMQLVLDEGKFNQYLQRFLTDSVSYTALLDSARGLGYESYIQTIYSLVPVIERAYDVRLRKDIPQERLDAYFSIGGTPHLDDQYTVFGEVVEGMAVVDSIAGSATDQRNKPLEDILIDRVVLEEVSVEEIVERYGVRLN